jgi:hypothetical protein
VVKANLLKRPITACPANPASGRREQHAQTTGGVGANAVWEKKKSAAAAEVAESIKRHHIAE